MSGRGDLKARRILAKVSGGEAKGTCLVTVIGVRWLVPSGFVFADPSCQPLVVYALPPAHREPSARQKAEALQLWTSTPDAPAAYLFPASRLPLLTDGPTEADPAQLTANPGDD